jgi:hypothetical protein
MKNYLILPAFVKSIGSYENPELFSKLSPQSLCSSRDCKLNIERIPFLKFHSKN